MQEIVTIDPDIDSAQQKLYRVFNRRRGYFIGYTYALEPINNDVVSMEEVPTNGR